jgi:subtilisin family serine protease
LTVSPGRSVAAAAAAVALVLPSTAAAGRYAVGLEHGADRAAVRAELERRTGGRAESLAPLQALVATARTARALQGIPGVRYVERLTERRTALVPNDPLVASQWYLTQNRSYDAWQDWQELAPLAPVRVAVIDSGIDGSHPELASHIAAARSFVGGSALTDTQGHGTFVAGVIAAGANDGVGIAGLAPSAELVVAKVVTSTGTIPVEAEVKAIRWAVASGARVINMSLGGLRDPNDPSRDTYSRLEAEAIAYAVGQGAVVVAAVGNGDQAPSQPWKYASWPAALPHVLGVSALARNGASPLFSNRDAVYNDIAAPGQEILSTFPLSLTALRPACPDQGYSSCGPGDYQEAEGTSFAAPQVSAAAATLLATLQDLTSDQVVTVLERSAVDATPANGCLRCLPGRDALTGWGHLDVTAALGGLALPLPAPDRYEPNDDAGNRAFTLWGTKRVVSATLDFWDDQNDVYRVFLRRGQRLFASLAGPVGTDPAMALWRPGTQEIDDLSRQDLRVRRSTAIGPNEHLGYRARAEGWYSLLIKLGAPGSGPYRLTVVKK